MEKDQEYKSVQELLDLVANDMLRPNLEYQRGEVWSPSQKKKFIDSVMRAYPLPLIYLHFVKKDVAGYSSTVLDIIDGQQRINALKGFAEGAYTLFDPVKDHAEARFPVFLQNQPCQWAGMNFQSLSQALKDQFLATKLPIAIITSSEDNEVRDLFVRLQAGLPLNPQEKRDAYPGQFTDFVLQLGGKAKVDRYPGHPFFQRVMRMKPDQDRGKTRQLAAQIAMLYLTRKEHGPDHFIDISSISIDDFYYQHIDFDADSSHAKRLWALLDKLTAILGDNKRPKPHPHDGIHLVLLADSLWDDYTHSWEGKLAEAVDRFSEARAKAKMGKESFDLLTLALQGDIWAGYSLMTKTHSDRSDNIRSVHKFYTARMHEFLQPLQLKDPKRLYGQVEREIIYFRDNKNCQVCDLEVDWAEAEIHHIEGHAQGGQTTVENAVLVHARCHPKGKAATEAFRNKLLAKKPTVGA